MALRWRSRAAWAEHIEPGGGMEFRILGPLEVLEDGRPVDLGGVRQRALLAILLLHANEVVSTDRLIDALWEEGAPRTSRKALQNYVSHLRKVLGEERLRTRAPGYLVRVEPDELDLARFQRFAASGQPADALSLWRGPALAEFAYQRFAETEVARLEELRLDCIQDRIEIDLTAGRHSSVVGELEALVKEHPLREGLRAQLMLALYRSGRQAEALEVFQEGRRALVEELGIEPSRVLRELERAILQQDPTLDLEPLSSEQEELPPPPSVPAASMTVTREARKTVTVLFVGITTSSERGGRLDPEALRHTSSRAFSEAQAVVEHHGGSLETVASDGLTAVFGLPLVHEDDALRGIRAADEIRGSLIGLAKTLARERETRLEVRIGVSTGEVVTGSAMGAHLRATGEPLTMSPWLVQAAQAGEILLDETTNRLVRDSIGVEPQVVDSIPVFRLVQLRDAVGHVSRFVSPMVGRERERRRLHDAFEQALSDRSCQLFTLLGPAGVGKSRLVQEFLGDVSDQAVVARGRCLPYGEGITYWPVLEAVKDVAGLDDAESSEQSRLRLDALLKGEEEADLVAQRMTEILGLAETVVGAEDAFQAVRKFFEALARERPLVLVFDDVHWGEATFLDLVEHIADWSRDAPLVLVCIARPELLDARPSWGGGKLNATAVSLEPLSDEQCSRLIEDVVGEAELAEEVKARIQAAAEGNPLFVEEMVSMLIEDGLLVRENGHWAPTRDLADVPVPPTIHALLAARLDQLDDLERAVIEPASVEGKVFHQEAVAELALGAVGSAVDTSLAVLVRKELIRPERPLFIGERAFRFRHLLIRDAAYESIPKQARAAFHERYAAWLERAAVEHLPEYEEIIGYHLEQAFRYRAELGTLGDADRAIARRAAERLGSAGRRAFVRSDGPAAVNLISRAVSLLPPDDPTRVDLVPSVRVAQGLGGNLDWALEVLDEAIAAGDDLVRAHALVQRGLLQLFTGPDVAARELIEVAEWAIEVFEARGGDLGLARAWRLVAQANYLARRAGPSVAAAERALVHARRAKDPFEEREIVQYLLVALLLGPAPAPEGAGRCTRLLEEAAGDPVLEAYTLGTLAYLVAIQGDTAEARDLLARSRSLLAAFGGGVWQHPVYFAVSAVWESDPTIVERELRPGFEALVRIGEKSAFSSLATLLAKAVYAQGRYDEAEDLAQEARGASRPIDVQCETTWRTVKAKVLAQRGESHAAETLAREAIAFVEQSDFLPVHADALMDLAEVLRLVGRPDESSLALEKAMRIYKRKGDVVATAKAAAFM
jgi:DNA-binding SARP family transcriptional activator/tetratricopeptide (TPR) repeat protein